jgi:catechol 2,3-dioxygenase-like lactoylglutathione lyase family enzyme
MDHVRLEPAPGVLRLTRVTRNLSEGRRSPSGAPPAGRGLDRGITPAPLPDPTTPHYRIHHVQIAAPPGSEATARAYFRDLLGMEEIPKPANLAPRGGVWFEVGDTQLHVGIEAEFRPAEKAHPAFEVDDLADLKTRLTNAGKSTWADEPFPGRDRFYTRDPFGNRLEFLGPARSRTVK